MAEIQQLISRLAGPQYGSRPPPLQALLAEHVSRVNAESITLYPDELLVLREVCRKIDEEPTDSTSWDMVAEIARTDVFERPAELKELQEAVSLDLRHCTVAYVRSKEVAPGQKQETVATGILVEVADRIFVATTAHSIPNRPSGKLYFVGNPSASEDENTPQILNWARSDDDNLRDVAFVELEKRFIEKLGKTPILLSRLNPCGPGEEKRWTMVCGYPARWVKHVSRDTRMFTAQCWACTLLMPADWYVLGEHERRLPNEAYDMFIPYPPADDVVSLMTNRTETLVEPHGMSGGGYWQSDRPRDSKELWTPECYRLVAIQSRRWNGVRYLHATQIIHWLKLLWDHRAELRPELEKSFPQLTV